MTANVLVQTLIFTAAVGGFVFFAIRWMQLRRDYNALSRAEQRRAEILERRGAHEKVSVRDRIRAETVRLGLGDSLFPFFAAVATLYLAVAAPLTLTNVPTWLGLLIAIPFSVFAGWMFVSVRARKRRSAFNRQLVDLLDLTVAQVKGGVGAERALQIVVPQMQDPIREEMLLTLAAGQAGRDLVAAMRELGDRYPSRAMEMFIAALEIDRAEGHAIAPALGQASSLLKQDFQLAAEANAKLGQVKYEFYAVAAIVGFIAVMLIFTGGEEMSNAYRSFGGLVVLLIALGNAGIGFFRFHRKLSSLTGDTK